MMSLVGDPNRDDEDGEYDWYDEDYEEYADTDRTKAIRAAFKDDEPEPENNDGQDLEYLTLEIADELCNHAIATCRAN